MRRSSSDSGHPGSESSPTIVGTDLMLEQGRCIFQVTLEMKPVNTRNWLNTLET